MDENLSVEGLEQELARVRDTMIVLIGLSIVVFGVVGLKLDLLPLDARTVLIVYGGLFGVGGLLVGAGLIMGVVSLLKGKDPPV